MGPMRRGLTVSISEYSERELPVTTVAVVHGARKIPRHPNFEEIQTNGFHVQLSLTELIEN